METWEQWPEWVPEEIRQQVMSHHNWHGGIKSWHESAARNCAPDFGSVVSLKKLGDDKFCAPGRFVFAWNNIGRVVHEDGSFDYVSFTSSQDELLRHLL